ncbi:MAG: hypothetical protein K0U98_25035 [Deltaproteobacteria bacterium]|nr:hypothetical protein [Deltaproteobacteria bacterium]
MSKHPFLSLFAAICLGVLLDPANPTFAQPSGCSVIPNVVANWDPSATPPPPWQGADPALLTDGGTVENWYYYWENSGPPIEVIFTIPSGYAITGVRWHDHYGDGDVTLDANGQTLTFSTDLWPLDWHEEAWSPPSVTSVSLTTSSNNTKVSELSFCGNPTTVDTTPPEVVQNINITAACTSLDISWSASQDFDNSNAPSGNAAKYLLSWNGQPEIEVFGLSYQLPATPNTLYNISLVAVDAAGNQSAPATESETTPTCPTGGTCTTISGVTADWDPTGTPPQGWQAPSPSILVDGDSATDWFYYWESDGAPVPVLFDLPSGSNLSGVRWHDHYGDGSITLTASGSTTTFSTDLWPLGWHEHAWSVSNVSSISMTTSSNNTKITELTFCSVQGPMDTVPPDPVDDLAATVSGCATASFSWSASVDYDANGPSGTASSYLIWSGTNPPAPVASSPVTLNDLVPDSNNTVTIIALDAFGNQSTPHSISVSTSPCSGGLDEHLATIYIIDSFGEAVAPVTTGHQWHAINSYYDQYYADGTHDWSLENMCSKEIHNSYWVLADENGQPAGSEDYDGDGDYESYYPTWHPPIHDEGGSQECYFMHDHGEDPTMSPLYDLDDPASIGVPFGYVHSKLGNMNGRDEDHMGHKSVVENNFTLVDGNPYGAGAVINEIGINCNWLSKIHQGSHSSDALGNNLHEYFLNIVCDDNPITHVQVKELVTWGYPNKVFNEGSDSGPSPCSPGIEWFWAGYEAVDPVHSPDQTGTGDDQHIPPGAVTGPFQDGKREFGCYADRHGSFYSAGAHAGEPQFLAELWKPDSSIAAPNGSGTAIYSPYYVTLNATRYIDPNWLSRFDNDTHDTYLGYSCDGGDTNGVSSDDCQTNQDCMSSSSGRHDGCEGTGAMVSSVDLCVRGSDAWNYSILAIDPSYDTNGQYPGFCSSLNSTLRSDWEQEIAAAGGDSLALSEARKYHRDNPFDGTKRGVHPKTIQVYAAGSTTPNYMGLKLFCTNAFGDAPTWPDLSNPNDPTCPTGTIMQVISPLNNNWGSSSGSSAGAVNGSGGSQNPNNDFETNLIGGGEGAEFVIDDISSSSNKVRAPN